ncbi:MULTISPECIES: ATP-binding protein [Nocardiopsis]|uniref:Histidine kinase/HSP90-like ATPase domain-containing protein n=1 Tax=Nocardiopsis sinuspersici TaxID=501010 RepID=A0A1V3C5A7_9ACTN|nr:MULTISPECIES: ATP-binding protein [Nocardiopsis]OOC55984.1 hypothetical protein NOSIN_20865 [Nocardiopsis sinuspersici]
MSLLYWEPRSYGRGLADLSAARRDLAGDLSGFAPDLVDTARLCLHELHANACKYGRPGGEVTRHLVLNEGHVLRLTVHNDHGTGSVPRVPVERTGDEWDRAEGQRGLLLVDGLADGWGHYAWPVRSGLGVLVWASFALDPAAVPREEVGFGIPVR